LPDMPNVFPYRAKASASPGLCLTTCSARPRAYGNSELSFIVRI
jgi:hypothetical protein